MSFEADKNSVVICGAVDCEPHKTHSAGGWDYYGFALRSERLSGCEDVVNISAPSFIFLRQSIVKGSVITVRGVMRSRNMHEDGKYRLLICVCAREIEKEAALISQNSVLISGAVCKIPIFRETPLGRRVCDVMLASRRSYGKADFLPLIAWGRNAEIASGLTVGSRVECEGRFQSREYIKKTGDAEETKTAYEISVSKIAQL